MEPAAVTDETTTEQQDSSYLPSTVDPSLALESEEDANAKSAEERVETLFGRMRPCRGRLNAILGHCRQPRTLAQIEQDEDCARVSGYSIYDVPTLCRLLVRAGGLDEQAAPAPEARVVEVNGVEYLEPAQPDENPTCFVTTKAGLRHLEVSSSLAPFEAILAEEPRYEHVYRILLDLCANDGGATAKQLEDAVLDDPELQEPRMYASYFYDRLDSVGLVAWTGSWTVTATGRDAIALLDSRA